MQYELTTLQELIVYQLSGRWAADITRIELEEWVIIARDQAEVVKRKWVSEVFSLKKEKYIELYIQNHQTSLIHLADQLLTQMNAEVTQSSDEPEPALSLNNVRKIIYQILDDLLSFMEKHFTKYFDQDVKIPDRYKMVSAQEMGYRLAAIRTRIIDSPALHPLTEIALEPMVEFINSPLSQVYTFSQLLYLKLLSEELQSVEIQGNENDQKRQLMYLLAYLNFNSFRFFDYCVNAFVEHYRQSEVLSEQLERLACLRKVVNQLHLKPGVSLKEKHDSIKTQLQEWIYEEVHFLESQKQLTVSKAVGAIETYKIKVNLSVNQLAYLVRLQVEAGLLPNKDLAELFRFLSQHVQTKQAENVTSESIRTKYYNVEQSTKDKVKEVLIGLLNLIRKKS